jgi:phage shock protein A
MPRSAASIQAEIDAIEEEIPKCIKAQSASDARGVAVAKQRYSDLTKRLDELYAQQDAGGAGGYVPAPGEFVEG